MLLCLRCCAPRVHADVQKLAKQAIFSAHRDDVQQCAKRLKEAEHIARELLPMINELPGLRHGYFSNSMEEVQGSQELKRSTHFLYRGANAWGTAYCIANGGMQDGPSVMSGYNNMHTWGMCLGDNMGCYWLRSMWRPKRCRCS